LAERKVGDRNTEILQIRVDSYVRLPGGSCGISRSSISPQEAHWKTLMWPPALPSLETRPVRRRSSPLPHARHFGSSDVESRATIAPSPTYADRADPISRIKCVLQIAWDVGSFHDGRQKGPPLKNDGGGGGPGDPLIKAVIQKLPATGRSQKSK
jgi:hypothetical protein